MSGVPVISNLAKTAKKNKPDIQAAVTGRPVATVAEPVKEVVRATEQEKRAASRRRARRIGARSLLGGGGATREDQDTLGVG